MYPVAQSLRYTTFKSPRFDQDCRRHRHGNGPDMYEAHFQLLHIDFTQDILSLRATGLEYNEFNYHGVTENEVSNDVTSTFCSQVGINCLLCPIIQDYARKLGYLRYYNNSL